MKINHARLLFGSAAILGLSLGQASTAQTAETHGGPAGIYTFAKLDPDTVIDAEFITGHTARVVWEDLNPADGQFEFAPLDALIKKLETVGQKMSLELFVLKPPAWLINDPAVVTYEHFNKGTQPVPWDTTAMSKWSDLLTAYATHPVELGDTGQFVPLAEHPVLEMVNAPVVGLSSFRDVGRTNPAAALVSHVDYDRQKFLDAAKESILASREAFPDQNSFVGYFGMSDDENALFGGMTLEQSILQMLDVNFDGADGPLPALGLFQELLSDAGPNPGSKIDIAQQQLDTFVIFQALSAWTSPFNPNHVPKVTSMNPATGIELAYNNFGSTFFEIYPADINNALAGFLDAKGNPILDDLIFWNDFLVNQSVIPEPASALLLAGLGFTRIRRCGCTPA